MRDKLDIEREEIEFSDGLNSSHMFSSRQLITKGKLEGILFPHR